MNHLRTVNQAPEGSDTNLPVVGVLGLGRFGRALVRSLRDIGYTVAPKGKGGGDPAQDRRALTTWARRCEVLCLAVRDMHIASVVAELSGTGLKDKTVLIHSGATPLDVLTPLEQEGAIIGKLHPLQSFTRAVDLPIPKGTPFAVEGEVLALVKPWVEAWSGTLHPLSPEQWLIYHVAAVTAANFLPLFIRAGAGLLEPLARDAQDALQWLRPLVQTSVDAALDADNHAPFSGPAVRDDQKTIQEHEDYLAQKHPDLLPLYRLATQTVRSLIPDRCRCDGREKRQRRISRSR